MQVVYLQTKNRTSEIINGLTETARNVQPTRMFCSVAYASLSGCKLLHENLLDAIPTWNDARKDWLVGIDNGITEPKSLEYLASLPKSTVRLFDAEYLLENNLQPRQKFHTKLFFFEANDSRAIGVFSGSANLTLSGLHLNIEQGISAIFQGPFTQDEQEALDHVYQQKQILESVYDTNVELSTALYEQYKNLCEERQEFLQNEDKRITPKILEASHPEFNMDKAAAIATAFNFWIESRYVVPNLGKGRAGNQIDLQRGSRVFFGFDIGMVPRNTVFGRRIISYRNGDYECGLRYGNNQMDKLNLPPPDDLGIDTYEDKILVFTRLGEERFNLQIFPLGRIERFRKLSSRYNSLYQMKGGRQYGVF